MLAFSGRDLESWNTYSSWLMFGSVLSPLKIQYPAIYLICNQQSIMFSDAISLWLDSLSFRRSFLLAG